jgi:hypothetical protein
VLRPLYSVYCLCVNVYRTTANQVSTQFQFNNNNNCSYFNLLTTMFISLSNFKLLYLQYNTYQLLYIYSECHLMMGNIGPKHVEVEWRNKLRINSASSWFSLQRLSRWTASKAKHFHVNGKISLNTNTLPFIFIVIYSLQIKGCSWRQGKWIGQKQKINLFLSTAQL